jgi:polysaccharide export outer membrane protein
LATTEGRFVIHRRLLILQFMSLSGCAVLASPGAGLAPLPPPVRGAYRLGAGDAVLLRIYDQPQLSGEFDVDDSGNVDLPLLGLVPAAGKTTDELSNAIALILRQKNLILAPSVAVEISKFRPFYILGEVNAPGQYPFRPGMTVLTAVSIAGGFTYRAVQSYVGVTRDVALDSGTQAVQYRAENFALVAPGDVITVFERHY